MKIKKFAATVAAAAVLAVAAPKATMAYADDATDDFSFYIDGVGSEMGQTFSDIENMYEAIHTYKLEFEPVLFGPRSEFAVKDCDYTKFICEFSCDTSITLSPMQTSASPYGIPHGLLPSWKLENLTGDIKETVNETEVGTYYDYSLGSEAGGGSGSFTFDATGREPGVGGGDIPYIPVILFELEAEAAGSVEFTIKPLDGGAQTPGDEKPGDPEKKTVEFKNEATNVSVSAAEGVVPEGAELSVTPGEITDTKCQYNICFKKDGKEVQPNGKVTVKLPLPEGLKGKPVYVYRVEADGRYTYLKSKVDGDFVSFETDHFSKYLLSTEALDNATPENPDTGVEGIGFTAALAAIATASAGIIVVSRKRK